MKRYILFLFSIAPALLLSQSSNLGNWLIYIGSKKLNPKFNFHHEIQYRSYDAIGDLEQLLLRTGIGYNVQSNSNLLLGYAYILSENYSTPNIKGEAFGEHRIFQQYLTSQQFKRVSLQHRYRFEQRFFDDSIRRLRFRYFLAAKVPINKPTLSKGAVFLSLYNELFINAQGTYFDRNRVYGGLGYKISPGFQVELAYMNQIFQNGSRDQINIFTVANF